MNPLEKDIISNYDFNYQTYHDLRKDPKKMPFNHFIEEPGMMSEISSLIEGRKVHDLGCGSGVFTEKVYKLKPEILTAQDSSKVAIDIAKKEAIKKASGLTVRYSDAKGKNVLVKYGKNLKKSLLASPVSGKIIEKMRIKS